MKNKIKEIIIKEISDTDGWNEYEKEFVEPLSNAADQIMALFTEELEKLKVVEGLDDLSRDMEMGFKAGQVHMLMRIAELKERLLNEKQ